MTIKKKISIFLFSFVGLFALFIGLNAFWLNSLENFLAVKLFSDLSIARNFEKLASSWLSLRVRSHESTKFTVFPVYWLAQSSFENITRVENEQELLMVGNSRLPEFEKIKSYSKEIQKRVRFLQERNYSFLLTKITTLGVDAENLLTILEEIREDRENIVALCRSEATFFRTSVEDRVEKMLLKIKEQYANSFIFLLFALLASLSTIFYLPGVIANPIVSLCEKLKQFEPGKLIPSTPKVDIHEIDLLEGNFQSLVFRIKIDFDVIKRYISAFSQTWGIFSTLYKEKGLPFEDSVLPGLKDLSFLAMNQLPKINLIHIFTFSEGMKNLNSYLFSPDPFCSASSSRAFFQRYPMQKVNLMLKVPVSEGFRGLLRSSSLWSFSNAFFPKDRMIAHFPPEWPETSLEGNFCLFPLSHTVGWSQNQEDSLTNCDKQIFGVAIVFCDNVENPWTEEEMTFLNLISTQFVSLHETGYLLQKSFQAQRMQFQLELAKEIQLNALPHDVAPIPGLTVDAVCQMADAVGGDFYDVFPVGKQRLGVIIADISGKSISAALRMMVLKTLIKTFPMEKITPTQFLAELSRLVSLNFSNDSFVTMIYFIVDSEKGELILANAGHLPLILYSSAKQETIELTTEGCALGISDFPFVEKRFPISPGDIILGITDGVTECKNPRNQLFGLPSVKRVLSRHSEGKIVETLLSNLHAFRSSTPVFDDITIVAVKIEGAEKT